jgi:uncharacterized protein YndB with AHSA1/START domain
MSIEFEIFDVFSAAPQQVYDAWLDSEGHSQLTGGAAEASAEVGGEFGAWDGYISGKNLELEPGKRILQSWRTQEISDSEADSELEVLLENVPEGTRLTLKHTKLPDHGMQYKDGWVEHYFEPKKAYFKG